MPSIPQSLLWISLVVLWLFVLVPMLINKRENVRRTSDIALATRVLNGKASRLLRRRRPAAGHRSDPHWQPEPEADDYDDIDDDATGPVVVTARVRSVAVVGATVRVEEIDYLDVDVVDVDSGALPVGSLMSDEATDSMPVIVDPAAAEAPEPAVAAAEQAESEQADDEQADDGQADDGQADDGQADDEYEYMEDTGGLEPEATGPRGARTVGPRSHYATKTAALVSARKYRFRSRTLMTMCALLALFAAAGLLLSSSFWWACATMAVGTLLYLAYLRRQTRIEDRLRRRRMARMARSHLGVENTRDREMEVVPTRLRQPGAVVLEIDEEDPIFEDLEEIAFARTFYDLPRAAGQ